MSQTPQRSWALDPGDGKHDDNNKKESIIALLITPRTLCSTTHTKQLKKIDELFIIMEKPGSVIYTC